MNTNSKILITGGTGFIGSHTCIELIENNYKNIVIIDNLSNSTHEVIDQIEQITNVRIPFYNIDLVYDIDKLDKLFVENKFDLVIHFAGSKAVAESINKPLYYYINNIEGTLHLIDIMTKYNCRNLIFSSSCTVYGNNNSPYDEFQTTGLGITNPYGKTKYMIEEILKDLYNANNNWNITILRYFNPVGAHPSGLIGENSNASANNLMPHILKASIDSNYCLNIYGNDYPTLDGYCVRDFIHVVDVAVGHIKCIDYIHQLQIYNLGTGKGTSVKELIDCFQKVNNVKINYKIVERRKGDLASSVALVDAFTNKFNWVPVKTLNDICISAYRYVINK